MPNSTQYQAVISSNLTATIANTASLSDAMDLSGTTLAGYIMPASWTSANMTFQVSVDGTNFHNFYDQFGNEVSHTVSTSRFVALNPSDMASVRYIKFRSGTNGTPVAQGADRLITLVSRAV